MTNTKLKTKILVIDVGGTHVKLLASGQKNHIRIDSGPTFTPRKMVVAVRAAIPDWNFDGISMGYPGPVLHGRLVAEPHNMGRGWVGFNFQKAFGCPIKMVNDAAMQALGSYEGGQMLFLGLGTGLGSALVVNGTLVPLELAHLPYKKNRTYEDYVGAAGLQRFGKKAWRHHVNDVVARLKTAMQAEYVVLGGGNAKVLKKIPAGARLGNNDNAFRGGFRLWQTPAPIGKTRAVKI
ncbi:MAG TPA: ROK family protein [Verrucomicrobiae bacterium]